MSSKHRFWSPMDPGQTLPPLSQLLNWKINLENELLKKCKRYLKQPPDHALGYRVILKLTERFPNTLSSAPVSLQVRSTGPPPSTLTAARLRETVMYAPFTSLFFYTSRVLEIKPPCDPVTMWPYLRGLTLCWQWRTEMASSLPSSLLAQRRNRGLYF